MLTRKIASISTAFLLAHAALAQTDGTFLLVSTNTVSPATPTTTIEIWATWHDPAGQFFFGGADYGIVAGEGLFSDPINILNGPGSSAGIANGNTITGGLNGQPFGFPCFCQPAEDNPMLLASYTWTTTDFAQRTVDLATNNTSNFIVGSISSGAAIQLYPGEFTPGSGVINVVPAPAAWLVGALPCALASARRRRHPPRTGLAIGLAIGSGTVR